MKAILFLTLLPLGLGVLQAKKPNVLFILIDDMSSLDLSNEGSEFYESPNVDRIANEGMKFTRGYATCQVCSPSRASILTGKYPHQPRMESPPGLGDASGEAWGKRGRHDSHFPPEYERNLRASEITLAEVMKDAGYKTFFAGKWHLGSEGSWPTDHGFEINRGGWGVGSPRGGFFSPWQNPNLESGPAGESRPFGSGRRPPTSSKPTRTGPSSPTFPLHGARTDSRPLGLWKKYRDKAEQAGLADERFLFDRRLNVRQVQDCPIYAGMIELMDDAIGTVLDKLDEHGLDQNTIVCFYLG